jgi:amino acid transporter
MAENGQLPKAFGSTHQRFHTPVISIAVTAVVSIGLAVLSTFISALTISTVVRLIAYVATCAALPLLRRREGANPPAFHAPAGTLVSVAAVVLSLWLLSNTASTELRMSVLAILLGFVVYAISLRSARL